MIFTILCVVNSEGLDNIYTEINRYKENNLKQNLKPGNVFIYSIKIKLPQ